MNNQIFRQVSLDRLSSPEQLDQLLRITGLREWIILFSVLILLTAAFIWSVEGRVVTTSAGIGVIVREGGVLNVVSHGSGVVTNIVVKPGTEVKANEIVATIAQPALLQQLQLLGSARDEAMRNREQNLQLDENAAQLKLSANNRQRANIESTIGQLQERAKLATEQIKIEQQLFLKGLVTNQQVLDLKQQLVQLQEQIASGNAQLKQLAADQFVITTQPKEHDIEMRDGLTELNRQIATAKEKLTLSHNVISPYDGEVLEVKTSPGSAVTEAQPIMSIQPRQQSLELLAYIPSSLAKDVRVGMETEVSPSNIKREEYGFIRGHVAFVADYPSTQAAIMRNFENDALAQELSEHGMVTEIHATLKKDATTPSGFAWSTSRGPGVRITSGTICQVDIVTKSEKPISLILPYLKSN